MKDLISIIIPIYNKEKYISRCIESMINQSYTNLEILLIDDGSIDNTKTVINKYLEKDSRIKYYFKKNGGVSSARNFGLEHANGKYIMFVDADDYISLDYVDSMHNCITCDDANIVVSGMSIIDGKKEHYIGLKKPMSKVSFASIVDDFILNINFSSCVRAMYQSKVIKDIRFNEKISFCEDRLFLFEVLQKGAISYLPINGYKYVQNADSVIHDYSVNNILKHINNQKYFFNKVINEYPQKEDMFKYNFLCKINTNLCRLSKNKSIKYREFKNVASKIITENKSLISKKYIRNERLINKLRITLLFKNKYLTYYILNKIIYLVK